MINVEHLFYEYPEKRALDNITFSVPEGSITALVGPNGSGKTTLLRCIAALEEPFSGNITIDNIDVSEHPRKIHKKLGYLSDFFGLYDELTVRQCLIFIASLHQLPSNEIKKQVEWVKEILELTPYMDKKAGTLSRGWRQRLGIAQAIIHTPKLLLLDEPSSGLDPEARVTISKLFRKLQDAGITIIVSSHILAELEDYCTDMLILRDGKLVEHSLSSSHKESNNIIEILFLDSADIFLPRLQSMDTVLNPTLEKQTIQFKFSGDKSEQYLLLKNLIEQEAKIISFHSKHGKLQDIYMSFSTEGTT
ncbi:MAG: ABC transporter ATP-binding protein [Rickettsiales bacterium]